jgi:hypothetical protein
MSFQGTSENRLGKFERSLDHGATRQAKAEELLAEFQQVLESAGYGPSTTPSASISPTSASTAEPRKSADIGRAAGEAVASADGSRNRGPTGRSETGHHQRDPIRRETRLRSRRWKLAAAGLALGFVAVTGAGLALMLSAPARVTPRAEVLAGGQSNLPPPVAEPAATSSGVGDPAAKDSPRPEVAERPSSSIQPPPGEPAATSGDVGDPAVWDGPRPDHAQAGGSDAANDGKESTAKTLAPFEAQRPADVFKAMALSTSTDAPAPAGASSASQSPPPDPVRTGSVAPEGKPNSATPSNSAGPASPSRTLMPHEKAAAAGAVRADSGRPPAAKMDSSTRPAANRTQAKKIAAKTEKAKAEATAEPAHPPLRTAPPERTEEPPAAQATVDPAASAAPSSSASTAPASFAAQSVGQLTHAFGYLTHLPAALVERVAGSNPEAK